MFFFAKKNQKTLSHFARKPDHATDNYRNELIVISEIRLALEEVGPQNIALAPFRKSHYRQCRETAVADMARHTSRGELLFFPPRLHFLRKVWIAG